MKCPICPTHLESYQEADLHLDRCPIGHGIWFDGGELSSYRKNHPEIRGSQNSEPDRFQALPGVAVKTCPRCTTATLEGGRLLEMDVRHCFTCHGVFLGQSLPTTQDPLNPTPIIVGSIILNTILGGFG